MKVKKLALIGVGYWGKVYLKYLSLHYKNLIKKIYYRKNLPNIKKYNFSQKILTNNLNEILKDKEINFVNIVTPIQTHAGLVIKALNNKKHVLVEKPLIMNQSQNKKIANLLKKNKVKLIVSYPYLFSKTLIFAKKIFKSKKLGSLKYVEINLQQCGRFMKYDVNYLLGPHAISILSMFCNLKNLKFKLHKIINRKNNCETSFITCLKKNKIIGNINLSINYANKHNKKLINLFFNNGTIICDLNNKKNTLVSFKYSRIQSNNYQTAKVKNYINKFFDEKNNMIDVINNFYFGKYDKLNFILTEKINNFLKNA